MHSAERHIPASTFQIFLPATHRYAVFIFFWNEGAKLLGRQPEKFSQETGFLWRVGKLVSAALQKAVEPLAGAIPNNYNWRHPYQMMDARMILKQINK